MDKKTQPQHITINPDVIVQEVEDELVLLHMGSEEYFSLDDVGTAMWKLLVVHQELEKVVSALLEMYDVDEDRLRRDVTKLIGQLAEKKLITVQDD